MATVDEFFKALPSGWRANVGHTPWWGKSKPKHIKENPFEAYVMNDKMLGTEGYVFASADGKSPLAALNQAMTNAKTYLAQPKDKERKK